MGYGARGQPGPPGPPGAGLAFASPADVAAYDATALVSYSRAGCGIVYDEYQFIASPSAALLAAADGVSVIAAAAPSGAVWARAFVRNLPAQYETTWFVDQTNGNDGWSGTSSTAGPSQAGPLKSMRELANRLRGAVIPASTAVTVTVAAGDYSVDPTAFDVELLAGASILVLGAVTTVSDVVAAYTATTPGAAETNSGATCAQLTATTNSIPDQSRISFTNGTASGCYAWVNGIVSAGPPTAAYIGRAGKYSNPRSPSGAVTLADPTVGDHFTIDTLRTQLGPLECNVRGPGSLVFQDCLFNTTTANDRNHRATGSAQYKSVVLYGCAITDSSSLQFCDGQGTLACSWLSSQSGVLLFLSSTWVARNCTFATSLSALVVQVTSQSLLTLQESCVLDNASFLVNEGGFIYMVGETKNDLQVVDCTQAHAIDVSRGSVFWAQNNSNAIWGLRNAMSGTALFCETGGQMFFNAKPSIPGGTGTDWNVGTATGAWASLPTVRTTTPGALACATT